MIVLYQQINAFTNVFSRKNSYMINSETLSVLEEKASSNVRLKHDAPLKKYIISDRVTICISAIYKTCCFGLQNNRF